MKKYLFVTLTILVSFVLLLFLTFFIDDEKIKEKVSEGLVNYNYYNNKKYNLDIDNYTDMIILNVMTYNNKKSFVKRTFGNEYGYLYDYKYGDKEVYWNQYENLKASLNDRNDSTIMYGRYWHGCLTILKPILRFFTYQQSLIVLNIVGLLLIIFSCILVLKNLGIGYLIAYMLSLISLNIYIFASCYQYFFSMITMIVFNIIVLLKYRKDFNKFLYFYIFGCLTSYFLYVSFPLITLCFPLLLYLLLEFKNGNCYNYKKNVIDTIKICMMWFIGYVLCYIFKWILGTLFGGGNFIENALMSINQRLGITFSFNYLDVLKLNIMYFFKSKFNVILFVISIVLVLFRLKKNFIEKIKIISPILIVLILPFIWMFVCNNHSAVHYWMISRIFSIVIFSLIIMIIFLNDSIKYDKLEGLNFNDYFIIVVSLSFILLYKLNIVFILIYIVALFMFKIDKSIKLFVCLLIFINIFLTISLFLSKKTFNNADFFQEIYKELYHKAKTYGEQYLLENSVVDGTKIDIKDLIKDMNADTVFLLSCKGYIIINNSVVTPYINCNDVIITDGYI